MINLATLTQVKEYQPQSTSSLDGLINALLPRASDHVRKWLSRDVPVETFTNKRLNGTGSSRMILPAWPIIELTRLNIDPAGPDLSECTNGISAGWMLDPDAGLVFLNGGLVFPSGFLNVIASWRAGYEATESATTSSGNTPTLTPSVAGQAVDVQKVTYTANGGALVEVTANPAAGQFSFNSSSGQLSFNSADANVAVTVAYNYVPSPIVQAVCELVILKIKQRDSIGVTSKSIANESISFEQRDMTPSIRLMLEPYKRRIPV